MNSNWPAILAALMALYMVTNTVYEAILRAEKKKYPVDLYQLSYFSEKSKLMVMWNIFCGKYRGISQRLDKAGLINQIVHLLYYGGIILFFLDTYLF
ncbi:hypothetical protein [Endozoicomonas elysicola]|uniref:Uncharacterized protein n=1 Tax=Endozoicomonas elysicola TaxID=305900 RepID=A0A081KBI8_9GAMM|nr:hypothetical protein [Endozoicomonas elysicola]KEI71514.1 hypothetical protein GV64_12880 [Endozoicomonas elysicola]